MLPNDDPSKDILIKSKPLGCFVDTAKPRDLPVEADVVINIQDCLTKCHNLKKKYAGLQNGFFRIFTFKLVCIFNVLNKEVNVGVETLMVAVEQLKA